MQCVWAIVLGKAIGRAIECEPPTGNAIGIATDDRTEVRRVFEVSGKTVVAEHNVVEVTGAVRCPEDGDDAAVGHHPDLDAVRVGERKELDAAPVGQLPEWRARHTGVRWGCRRVAEHKEHRGINRIAPESGAINRQSAWERGINLQPNDHLTGAGTITNRVDGNRYMQQLAV